MTLINFVEKAKLPTKIELETKIKDLGYNFKFLTDFEKLEHLSQIDAIDCELNGNKTFVEIYFSPLNQIISDFPELQNQLSDKDLAISFTGGSDQLVSACINVISIGLIDLCQSIVFYADDEMIYTREMLIEETSQSLYYIENNIDSIPGGIIHENLRLNQNKKKRQRNNQIQEIALWGLVMILMILKKRDLISWHFPFLLFAFVLVRSIIQHNKRKKV